MPFGEYELSPSLIGLSLLHTVHPEAFQRLLVRAFIPCYRDFTLTMCRSLGFASAAGDSCALFRLAFAAGTCLVALSLAARRQLVGSLCKRHAVTAKGSSDRL